MDIIQQVLTSCKKNFVPHCPEALRYAYKLYDPKMRKVVINRDVVVDETRCWNWETNSTEALKRLVMNLEDDQHKKSSVVARNQPRRSQRERHTPQTLNNYEMFPDTTITTEGDLV